MLKWGVSEKSYIFQNHFHGRIKIITKQTHPTGLLIDTIGTDTKVLFVFFKNTIKI